MSKIMKKFNVQCSSRITFHPYVQFEAFDMFHPKKKKLQKSFNIMWMGVYNTSLLFKFFFQFTWKWLNYSDSFFFQVNTNIKVTFSHLVQIFRNFRSKSGRGHKLAYFDSNYFRFDDGFHNILDSQGGSHGRLWYHMKCISYHALLKKNAFFFHILYI